MSRLPGVRSRCGARSRGCRSKGCGQVASVQPIRRCERQHAFSPRVGVRLENELIATRPVHGDHVVDIALNGGCALRSRGTAAHAEHHGEGGNEAHSDLQALVSIRRQLCGSTKVFLARVVLAPSSAKTAPRSPGFARPWRGLDKPTVRCFCQIVRSSIRVCARSSDGFAARSSIRELTEGFRPTASLPESYIVLRPSPMQSTPVSWEA